MKSIQLFHSYNFVNETFIHDNKNIYSYQIEQISKNILNGKNKASYPGMNLDETLLNMKIIEEWLNA